MLKELFRVRSYLLDFFDDIQSAQLHYKQIDKFKKSSQRIVDELIIKLKMRQYDNAQIIAIKHIAVASIDEWVCLHKNKWQAHWQSNSLQQTYFGTSNSGDFVYQQLILMLENLNDHRLVLSAYGLFFELGYKGHFHLCSQHTYNKMCNQLKDFMHTTFPKPIRVSVGFKKKDLH